MYAFEQHTGTEISLWRDQLLALRRAPFGTGPRDLMVAFAANAELSCFRRAGLAVPAQRPRSLRGERSPSLTVALDIWPPIDPMTGKPEK